MADYQEHLAEFSKRGIDVIAASSETKEEAEETIAKLGLSYPVAYGIDPAAFAELTGAFFADDDDDRYLHATGFILRPDQTVDIAVYSTGAIGRLEVEDSLNLMKFRLEE